MTVETVVKVDRYTVSCVSADVPDRTLPVLRVEWHSAWRRWVVVDGQGRVYDAAGKPAWPSSTPTAVLSERFSFADEVTALDVARRIAPTVRVAGKAVAETLAEMGGVA